MSSQENLLRDRGVADVSDRSGRAPLNLRERSRAMGTAGETFRSVLAPSLDDERVAEISSAPAFFRDLNLDQIVASIIAGKQEYNLAPFFHQPLERSRPSSTARTSCGTWRTGLASTPSMNLRRTCGRFGIMSRRRRKCTTGSQKQAWSLDAIELYCNAVQRLLFALRATPPRSAGLTGFLAYLDAYVASPPFQRLMADAAALKANLASIRYSLLIGDGVITVSAYQRRSRLRRRNPGRL